MRRVAVICAITASLFFGPPVLAGLGILGPVPGPYDGVPVDQYNQYNDGTLIGEAAPDYFYGSPIMAQTFTAGLTGILYAIQIGNTTEGWWNPQSPPVVEIRDTTVGGWPGSPLPGSGAVNLSTGTYLPTNGWGSFDFEGQSISVTAGHMYSIVLSASDMSEELVSVGAMKYPESYPNGALWTSDDDGTTWHYVLSDLPDIPVFDMQFRTYVIPVPLPAGIWLGICAVSVVGWHLKRQRG